VKKFKGALVSSYAGAIFIALLASTAITGVLQSIELLVISAIATAKGERSNYGPELAVFPIVSALILFLIAFLLLRWLYFPTEVDPAEEIEPAPEN
jgi:hypothetical protein